MKIAIILIFILSALHSCKKDIEQNPEPPIIFTVTPKIASAKITWQHPSDFDSLTIYSLYLDDKLLIKDSSTLEYNILNLKDDTFYSGKIVAYNQSKQREVPFNFKTKFNFPHGEISLFTNIITSDSLSISWDKSRDPDGSKIKYNTYINNVLTKENSSELFFNVAKLDANTTYNIRVASFDTLGKVLSKSVTIRTLQNIGENLIRKKITSGYKERQYCYIKPSGINYSKAPLFIYIHGMGGTPNCAWELMTAEHDKMPTEKGKFILAMLQSLQYPIGENNTMLGAWADRSFTTVDDIKYFEDVLNDLIENERIDESRIYLCGHSAGGSMTFILSRKFRSRIAAIAPIANFIVGKEFMSAAPDFEFPLPMVYFHATTDKTVPYDFGGGKSVPEMIEFWIRKNGCDTIPTKTELPDFNKTDLCTVTLFDYKGSSSRSAVRFYRVNGGNHAIPGMPSGNQDVNAFEAAWDFCKQFSNP